MLHTALYRHAALDDGVGVGRVLLPASEHENKQSKDHANVGRMQVMQISSFQRTSNINYCTSPMENACPECCPACS